MRARSRWALGLLAVGCAQPAPRPRPDLPAGAGASTPSAVVTSADADSGAIPDSETRPSLPTTIGDVTCQGDGDCATLPAATGMGFLTLLCAPACDHVVVDGTTDLGTSPMYKTPIAIGKHRLTLRVTSPKTVKILAVEIREGESTVVRVNMAP